MCEKPRSNGIIEEICLKFAQNSKTSNFRARRRRRSGIMSIIERNAEDPWRPCGEGSPPPLLSPSPPSALASRSPPLARHFAPVQSRWRQWRQRGHPVARATATSDRCIPVSVYRGLGTLVWATLDNFGQLCKPTWTKDLIHVSNFHVMS